MFPDNSQQEPVPAKAPEGKVRILVLPRRTALEGHVSVADPERDSRLHTDCDLTEIETVWAQLDTTGEKRYAAFDDQGQHLGYKSSVEDHGLKLKED